MAVTKNQEYTVTVEGYSGEGAGVARIDGFVVFVSGALRGEVCRILILKVLKSAAFAKVLEVLVPSPHRIAPDCPYFPRCGGCTYRHMDYAEELALKRRRVQDNLARIGGSEVEVEEILGAAETRRYRNKAQYPVSPDGRIGFYRARTHEVIDTRECLLVKPEADAAAEAVRQYMRDFRAAGYDERTGRGLLRHVYVRSNTKSESLICLLVNGKRLPHEAELVERLRRACPKAVGIVLGENTRRDNVILGERYRTLWGADRLEDVLWRNVDRIVLVNGGTILADLTSAVPGVKNVFAGGDAVSGPATVIRAVAAGKVAADNIDAFLGYTHKIRCDVEIPPAHLTNTPPCGRVNLTNRSLTDCKYDFELVKLGMSDEEAQQEASRCLRCDHFGYGIFKGGRTTQW